jgi:hypothetical protein
MWTGAGVLPYRSRLPGLRSIEQDDIPTTFLRFLEHKWKVYVIDGTN